MSILALSVTIYLILGYVYFLLTENGEEFEGFFEEWMIIFLWGPVLIAVFWLFVAIGIGYIFQKPILKIRYWYLKKRE